MISDNLKKIIYEHMSYAKEQGASNGSVEYYGIYEYVKELQLISVETLPLLSELIDVSTIMVTSGGEDLIIKGLRDGMKAGRHYKLIYQDIKSKVEEFAKTQGHSNYQDVKKRIGSICRDMRKRVISKNLALTEE